MKKKMRKNNKKEVRRNSEIDGRDDDHDIMLVRWREYPEMS